MAFYEVEVQLIVTRRSIEVVAADNEEDAKRIAKMFADDNTESLAPNIYANLDYFDIVKNEADSVKEVSEDYFIANQ